MSNPYPYATSFPVLNPLDAVVTDPPTDPISLQGAQLDEIQPQHYFQQGLVGFLDAHRWAAGSILYPWRSMFLTAGNGRTVQDLWNVIASATDPNQYWQVGDVSGSGLPIGPIPWGPFIGGASWYVSLFGFDGTEYTWFPWSIPFTSAFGAYPVSFTGWNGSCPPLPPASNCIQATGPIGFVTQYLCPTLPPLTRNYEIWTVTGQWYATSNSNQISPPPWSGSSDQALISVGTAVGLSTVLVPPANYDPTVPGAIQSPPGPSGYTPATDTAWTGWAKAQYLVWT